MSTATNTLSQLSSEQLRSLKSLIANSPQETTLAKVESLLGMDRPQMPLIPYPRQRQFLNLNCEEALYGGAAGGGKSECLLMWLAEGIDIPGYTGLIFRRTYPQISKSNEGLLAKAARLYKPLGGRWGAQNKQWTFPSGAMIEMGHLPYEKSVEDYQGPSYHRIAFDELTQFTETQYTYLFGRIRSGVGFPIALGVRASSNPGGEGHVWVKNRFVTKEAMQVMRGLDMKQPSPRSAIFWPTKTRCFVPARIADNPYINFDDYIVKLSHLPPVTRDRMAKGDWAVSEQGVIKADWLRYFEMRGDHYRLFKGIGEEIHLPAFSERECERFTISDCAGTSEDVAREKKGKPPSWSVISVFDFHRPTGFLIWRDCWRGRWDFPELCQQHAGIFEKYNPAWLGVEDEKTGKALIQTMRNLPMRAISHEGKGKLERAARSMNEASRGKLFLPRLPLPNCADWADDAIAELLTWTGDKDEMADRIDTWAYAGMHADRSHAGSTLKGGLVKTRGMY